MFDENEPRARREYEIGQKLDDLSIADLEAVVVALKAEIVRIEAARDRKASHLDAAQALFSRK